MAEANGEDKLIAVARHIAKTLGRSDTMADDVLQIFSTFDGRFSREKLSDDIHAVDQAVRPTGAGTSGSVSGDDEEDYGNCYHHHRRAPPPPPRRLERTLRSLYRRISRLLSLDRPIWSDSADASDFLAAFDDLLSLIPDVETNGDPSVLDHFDGLLHRSVVQLEDEFRTLLENPLDPSRRSPLSDSDGEVDEDDDHIPLANPVLDYDVIIDALPPGTMSELHDIARRMVAAGFENECAHTYNLSRRDFLEESVSRLGLRARTAEDVQSTSWSDLEDEIARWTRAAAVAFRILFPSERRLCDRIFAGLGHVNDLAFAESCRGTAIQLLVFADAVAVCSRAPERLFRVLDMYEAIRGLIPDLDSIFADNYSASIRSEAIIVWKGLGAAIRGIFMELENLIRRDPPKTSVPGGGLHPITRYVMNYLRAACASRRTLEEVMNEEAAGAAAPATDPDRPSSSLGVQIAWIMEVLQGNLEAKAKVYENPSLSCVFLINNVRYIIQKVKDNELGMLLGEDWIRQQAARVRRWHAEYHKGTWAKVLAVLRTDGGASGAGERLRLFNTYLEEILRTQKEWVVADEQMRAEMRVAVAEQVEGAYSNFLSRFRGALDVGRHGERIVKYRVQDLEAKFNELFNGGRR